MAAQPAMLETGRHYRQVCDARRQDQVGAHLSGEDL